MFWTDWFFNEKDRKSRNTEKVQLFKDMEEPTPGPIPAIEDDYKNKQDPFSRSSGAYRNELNKIVVDVQKAKNRLSDLKRHNDSELRQIESARSQRVSSEQSANFNNNVIRRQQDQVEKARKEIIDNMEVINLIFCFKIFIVQSLIKFHVVTIHYKTGRAEDVPG